MADKKNLKDFPELSNKLAAPAKKSLFERQRAETEAKRLREEAETKAALHDFVKSFEDEDGDSADASGQAMWQRPGNNFDTGPRAPAGPAKRHFTSAGRSSGPGSLGPPPNLSRKKTYDGPRRPEDRRRETGLFAFDDLEPSNAASALDDDDDHRQAKQEDERAAPKPTMQLLCLPPGTSPAVVKSLIPPLLKVEGVRILNPSGPGYHGSTERKSISAIVTLAAETPASDIDTVVTSLQNRYLGWGFNLSISRHLSSVALGSMNGSAPTVNINSPSLSLPFNAQPVQEAPPVGMNRVGAGAHRGGIAPPSSYAPRQQQNRGPPPVEVRINPPSDIKQVKLIHKTLESLVTHGPEFEALLMSRPEVQKEEKWSWLWNPRSPGGIWYRWRLWEVLTGAGKASKAERNRSSTPNTHTLFDGAALWTESDDVLPFEFTTKFQDLVSDSDYNSSDEDESGDEDGPRKRRRQFGAYAGKGAPPEGILNTHSDEQTYLNPLQKAKFTHLLARLPASTARLRKGDVARITAFAISHAGRGADEVVEMLVSNVVRPYTYSRYANPDRERENSGESDGMEESTGHGNKASITAKEDTTPSTLVALYCISDVLSASSSAGVRHSWRYRALIESALTTRKVFSHLGRLEKIMGWGRLRAEKWRRSIHGVLERWEQWCMFSAETHAAFLKELDDTVKKGEELEKREKKVREQETRLARGAGKSKWKAVDSNSTLQEEGPSPGIDHGDPMDLDEKHEELQSGRQLAQEPAREIKSDTKITSLESITPRSASRDQTVFDKHTQAAQDEEAAARVEIAPETPSGPPGTVPKRRTRPKAEDMFADSDNE